MKSNHQTNTYLVQCTRQQTKRTRHKKMIYHIMLSNQMATKNELYKKSSVQNTGNKKNVFNIYFVDFTIIVPTFKPVSAQSESNYDVK